MKNIHHAVAAVAVAILTFLLVIIAVEGAPPVGKVEDGPLAKPAAAALFAPLAGEAGKSLDGPIGK